MTALWIILAILALLAALLLLRLKLRVSYADGLKVSVGALFISYRLYPAREKGIRLGYYSLRSIRRREEKAKRPKKEKKRKKSAEEKAEAAAPAAADLIGLVVLAKDVVGKLIDRFGRYLRVDVYRLYVRVASDDAAKTGTLYGAVSQLFIALRELLVNLRSFRTHAKTRVGVTADFTTDKPVFELDLTLSLRVWQLLTMGLGAFLDYTHKLAALSELDAENGDTPEPDAGKKKKRAKKVKRNKTKTNNKPNSGGGANV